MLPLVTSVHTCWAVDVSIEFYKMNDPNRWSELDTGPQSRNCTVQSPPIVGTAEKPHPKNLTENSRIN